MTNPRSHEDYTVGWLCALPKEQVAASLMLDEEHPSLPKSPNDANTYTLGAIGPHNIAITCLPMNCYGTNQAARAAAQMLSTFPSIKIGLLVGIGAGIPSKVKLGDVVISNKWSQWDFGKTNGDGIFEHTSRQFEPPDELSTVMSKLVSEHEIHGTKIPQYLDAVRSKYPHLKPKYTSIGRSDDIRVHYGMIASGNQVVKDVNLRDLINKRYKGQVYCIEMEAAGLVGFPAVVIRGICDYADSSKNDEWQEYAAGVAAACAKEFLNCAQPCALTNLKLRNEDVTKILDEIATIRGNLSKEDDRKILNWITSLDFTSQQNDLFNRQEPGTGQRLLQSSEYQNWLYTAKQILFCSGMPGAGKTIATSIVINDLINRYAYNPSIGIGYIYFNFKGSAQLQVDDLLSSLLKQLALTQPSLPKCLKDLYGRLSGTSRPSRADIVNCLHSVAAAYSRVFIIVDALDEYQGGLTMFLEGLFKLHQKQDINIFATSRYIPKIVERFTGISTKYEIRASDEDVRKYLEGQISRANSNALIANKEYIKDKIVKTAQGMFLLAQLYFDAIKDELRPKNIRKTLNALSSGSAGEKGYDHAYKAAMERIRDSHNNESVKLAYQVLSWITCATRPLTILELLNAVAVVPEEYDLEEFEPGVYELDVENIPDIRDLLSLCTGLVTIDKESDIVRLVHYTTQEYFQRSRHFWFPGAHNYLAKISVIYLSYKPPQLERESNYWSFWKRVNANALYKYAAQNFGFHIRKSEDEDTNHIELNTNPNAIYFTKQTDINPLISKFLLDDDLRSSCVRIMLDDEDWPDRRDRILSIVSGLHLAAYNGLASAAKHILTGQKPGRGGGVDPEIKDNEFGRTPLLLAAETGHADIVKVLLEKGANMESRTHKYGQTPLSLAAEYGYANVVDLLLDKGAEIESKDNSGQTPLSMASGYGHADVAKILLEKGAEIESKSNKNKTPLLIASMHGHTNVVKVLLEKGANMESRYGQTPLSWAAEYGYANIVNLLLEKGANMEPEDGGNGQTPLFLAAQSGHANVVELLLEKGAKTGPRDYGWGQTPMSLAAQRGQVDMVVLLLKKQAEIDPKDYGNRTPLSRAAQYGHVGVVELLLKKQAEIDSKDNEGRTPLSWAAESGSPDVVELLLKKQAEIDSKDNEGRTPLSWAAQCGHTDVVELLLKKQAEIDSKDNKGQTPLSRAARRGRVDMVVLLLEKQAEIDSKDNEGRTPLSWAAESGSPDVVELLLKKQAEIDPKDNEGRTPLSWAAQYGETDVVELLLKKQAEIDPKDNEGRTPLSWAAESGSPDVVELLLKKQAEIDSKDNKGRTPLSRAAEYGRTDAVDLLLQNGADTKSKDYFDETPLSLAKSYGDAEVIELLLKYEEPVSTTIEGSEEN